MNKTQNHVSQKNLGGDRNICTITGTKNQLIFPELSKNQVVQTAFKIHKSSSVVEEVCLTDKLSLSQGGRQWGELRIRPKGRKLITKIISTPGKLRNHTLNSISCQTQQSPTQHKQTRTIKIIITLQVNSKSVSTKTRYVSIFLYIFPVYSNN